MATKRYDGGGRVSDSEDAATANARADHVSIEKAESDYGRGHTWIRNHAGTINPEPKVSPLIRIYAGGGRVQAPLPGWKHHHHKVIG